jgi:amidase
MQPDDLCFATARDLARMIRERELSAVEVLEAHLARIEHANPRVHAICTLVEDEARARARELDQRLSRGEWAGPLHGLPIAIKDLELTKGIRTTFGSRIYRDFVPEQNALFVDRLEDAGAVVIGKTNTPEFGAGSQTFNDVFGRTANPYDVTKTCGGSSGGAAVALASGMVPIADGSDLGGSTRNPPSFCNVVGLRPSAGRIPRWPTRDPWNDLSVLGPLARNVADATLLLSALAGPDPKDPLSISDPGSIFEASLERDWRGARLAWSPDLGRFPVERAVLDVLDAALPVFSDLGCEVEPAHPDFDGADDIFQILRAHAFALDHAQELEEHRDLMKDTVVWNIEKGLSLDARDLARARIERGRLYERVRRFFENFDFLLLPVTQVAPFDIEAEWVREIDGVQMETYVDWMKSCYYISVTGHPALSVPAGFTEDGLPVGIQIVGRYRGELDVLRLGHAFEGATNHGSKHPSL